MGVRSGERHGYANALDGLWNGLARTLSGLERYASEPDERLAEDGAVEQLSALQYALHVAGELAAGIVPPAGAEQAHAELASALADARDATADIVEAVEAGGAVEAAWLVPEWRGALFRVRLARLRLNLPRPIPSADEVVLPPPVFPRAAAAATALALCGTLVFAAGAALASWPVWAVGLLLFSCGFFVYRP